MRPFDIVQDAEFRSLMKTGTARVLHTVAKHSLTRCETSLRECSETHFDNAKVSALVGSITEKCADLPLEA